MVPVLQQFKFVAARLARTTISSDDIQGSSRTSGSEEAKQLNSYIISIGIGPTPPADALDFWFQQKHQYHKLAPVAHDLLAEAPASQAYVEARAEFLRLTARRRNRMNTLHITWNARMLKVKLARTQRNWISVFLVQFGKTSHSWNYLKLKWLFPAILIYYKVEMIGIKLIKTETEMNFKTEISLVFCVIFLCICACRINEDSLIIYLWQLPQQKQTSDPSQPDKLLICTNNLYLFCKFCDKSLMW